MLGGAVLVVIVSGKVSGSWARAMGMLEVKWVVVSECGVVVVPEFGVWSFECADVATEIAGEVIRVYLSWLSWLGGITARVGVISGPNLFVESNWAPP